MSNLWIYLALISTLALNSATVNLCLDRRHLRLVGKVFGIVLLGGGFEEVELIAQSTSGNLCERHVLSAAYLSNAFVELFIHADCAHDCLPLPGGVLFACCVFHRFLICFAVIRTNQT